MVNLFRDPLSEAQMDIYWLVLQPELSLEEWHYACLTALRREKFPKVPLPAVLLDYGLEYRALEQAQRREERAARGLPQRDLSHDWLSLAEVRALLRKLSPGDILPTMPSSAGEEIETDAGTLRYDSGRTAQEEQARKAFLRAQLDRSREPPALPQEGGAGG